MPMSHGARCIGDNLFTCTPLSQIILVSVGGLLILEGLAVLVLLKSGVVRWTRTNCCGNTSQSGVYVLALYFAQVRTPAHGIERMFGACCRLGPHLVCALAFHTPQSRPPSFCCHSISFTGTQGVPLGKGRVGTGKGRGREWLEYLEGIVQCLMSTICGWSTKKGS